jgi:hypothetical protein
LPKRSTIIGRKVNHYLRQHTALFVPVHLKIGSPEASSAGNNEKNFSIPFDFIPHFRTFAPVFRKLVLLLSLLIPALILPMRGQDSIRVTVLTCSPGQEVYSLYGHTAIRCQNLSSPAEGITPDVVFNYGVFDDTKPYFVWNFILGRTDYMVLPMPWEYFPESYRRRGSSIIEQELNLTQAEARLLMDRLAENCLPQNRNYRYNFLYNNCTTKVRDLVEQVVTGRIQYPDTLPHQTYREILHHYTKQHPWSQEGNDLLLGAEVDTLLSVRASMFVPEKLMDAFDGAFICTPEGNMRPLVKSKTTLLEAVPQNIEPELPILPWQATLAFAAICLLVTLLEAWTKHIFWLWDILLLLATGIAGTLLTFMLLFSSHPAVGSNWQVWVLNPIALVGIPLIIKAAIRRRKTHWYAFQFAVLALFVLFSPWIPQDFAKITVPLALCLLTRPISYHNILRRKKKK